MNSQGHSSTNQPSIKPLLAIYASSGPATRTWAFFATDHLGQLFVANFSKAPKEITADSDGITRALARAHQAISAHFPARQVLSCLTELRDMEVKRCPA